MDKHRAQRIGVVIAGGDVRARVLDADAEVREDWQECVYVPASQLEGAVEAGNAMYAVLDKVEDYTRDQVAAVMDQWLKATLDRSRGDRVLREYRAWQQLPHVTGLN